MTSEVTQTPFRSNLPVVCCLCWQVAHAASRGQCTGSLTSAGPTLQVRLTRLRACLLRCAMESRGAVHGMGALQVSQRRKRGAEGRKTGGTEDDGWLFNEKICTQVTL